MGKISRLKCIILRHGLLFTVGALLAANCSAMECAPGCCCPAAPKPKWHSVVMPVRTNLPPIHFYNKINPIWWFGNADEPRAPDWYRPNSSFRNVAWYFRNPLANFSNYVIGIGDKESVRSGRYPKQIGNPCGGWNFAVSHRHILYLPFIDYKRGRFEFYFGWREHGNFGIKLNFRQAPHRLNPNKKKNAPFSVPTPLESQSPKPATNSPTINIHPLPYPIEPL
ncbi:MAG: hypothetical protein PHY43_08930 [Verrucomicrobiales bacterium]|nr:hypothetical protein [Verrucomicrobiales bacterium]